MPTPHKDAPSEEELYAPVEWRTAAEFEDILYETSAQIAKITINRPEVRNAFRPQTLRELRRAFDLARDDLEVASIIFTGAGTEAFCSGGDQRIRGDDGYIGDDEVAREGIGRLALQLGVGERRARCDQRSPVGTGQGALGEPVVEEHSAEG